MKSSAIIDHTSPAAVKAQKTSLPIARSSGPGYERPERARTSHACEPCRERKTKCDGERPSCRRCLHTGTSCHYGYGKGWRKRKTAEDLSTTSKKLQRYEALLSEISSMVSAEVRAMIEDVRQQEASNNSASENNESPSSSLSSSVTPSISAERDRAGSVVNGRLPLTLPIPGSLAATQSRPQTSLPYERVSESISPHLAHHPKRESLYEDLAGNRLPSITATGVLIENGSRDTSPNYGRPGASTGALSAEHMSPPTGSSFEVVSPGKPTDGMERYNAASIIGLNESCYPSQTQLSLPTHLTV